MYSKVDLSSCFFNRSITIAEKRTVISSFGNTKGVKGELESTNGGKESCTMRLVNPQGGKEFREAFSHIQFQLSHFAQNALHSLVSQINACFIPLETICWISCRQI